MASWTNLTDAILGIGKPLTYVIARAWRDNAIAIAEGAVGAPRVVVPTALATAETNTSKVLAPDGSGGVLWTNGATPVSSNNGVKTAPQASAQTIISGLPAGKHLLSLVTHRVNAGGTISQGSNTIQVILDNTGSPLFKVVHQQGELGLAGWYPPYYNVTTFDSRLGGGTGTIGNITWTATSTGVTATWTNDSEYVMAFAVGISSN